MPTRTRRTSHPSRFILPVLMIALVAYFGWQAGRGDYGTEARRAMRDHLAELQAEHAALVAEREALEARVARLRPSALDADLLDERARAKLNLARPEEIVLFHLPRRSARR